MEVIDPQLRAKVRKHAWQAWCPFLRWVPWKDAEQELWAWWHERGYLTEPSTAPYAAWTQIRGYCQREKAVRSGYSRDDVYCYTTKVVEALIPETLTDLPATVVKDGSPGARTPPGEGGDLAAMVMDVRHALMQLDPLDRQLAVDQALDGPESGVDGRTATRRYHRVLDRMVGALGGPA